MRRSIAALTFMFLLSVVVGNAWGVAPPEFRPRVSLNVGGGALSVAAGDYDGDERLDVAVGNNLLSQIKVFYGQADGSLNSSTTVSTSPAPRHLASGDLNGDGCGDLIYQGSPGFVSVDGQINRTFTNSHGYSANATGRTAVVDLNLDGRLDMIATGGNSVTVYYGQPSGGFTGPLTYSTGNADSVYGRGMAIADFNVDGRVDIAVTNPSDRTISVLYGQSGGGFSRTDYPAARSYGMVSGDFNRDGRPDLAYTRFFGSVDILLGQVNGGFSGPSNFSVADSDIDIASGDFNRDDCADLAVVTIHHNDVTVLMGNGDGSFGGRIDLHASATGSASVTIADLDGNGWDDIAVASASGGYADIFYAVPEPSTFVLLGMSAIGLLGFAWRRRGVLFVVSLVPIVGLPIALSANSARAVSFSPGDIAVNTQGIPGSIYKIDPVSGARTLITSGTNLNSQTHLLWDSQGQLFTAVRGGAGRGIVRIDPNSGTHSLIASGSLLSYPVAFAFEQSNDLIVGSLNQYPQLIHVNSQSGTQTLLATLQNFRSLRDVDVDNTGQIVVLDAGLSDGVGSKIIRCDPATGQQTTVSAGGYLFNPGDLLIGPSGNYIVSNRLANRTSQILDINPITGDQRIALTVPSEGWIALQDQDNILYADCNGNLSILRANLLTGQTQTVAQYSVSGSIVGIAVYSPVPEPSTFVLLGMGAVGLLGFAWRRRKRTAV